MSTYIYLSNDPSDLSGYLKAYINTRSPNASATVSTAVTNTATVSTTTIAMTLTAGGSAAKWITVPLQAAVTIAARPAYQVWGLESNASANAMVAVQLAQYTTSLQSAFTISSTGEELGTSAVRAIWVTTLGSGGVLNKETVTSTAFAAGDRLAIVPALGPVGLMATGYTVTMDYNGLAASDGDTFVLLNETLAAGQAQVGSGDAPGIVGKGVSYFYDLQTVVANAQAEGLFSANATSQEIQDEASYQASLS